MPATIPNNVPSSRFATEPRRALLTPSASPSLGPPDRPPPKRPRLRSTPSSSISATPSTSNESTSSADVNSARRASTLRVLNTWAQLAERYNKRLDEDDIIDLHRYVIIKDRGAVEGASKEYHIGHFTQLDSDQEYPDNDQEQEDSEQDDDENELNALPSSDATTDDDAPISKKELLRGVPPLSATTDADDLREFLEAEKRRRELAEDEEDEEGMSPEQRSALRQELEERQRKKEAAIADRAHGEASAEPALEHDADATPTRPSTRIPPSDNESEDELALWTHDESTAVYPVAQHQPEQDVHEVNHEVIEITDSDSDSDEEFEAILTHPPRFARLTPLPVPQPKEVQQPLQSPPDSECGRPRPRTRSHSKIKSAKVTLRSEDRPRSPLVARKPEVILNHKRKSSVERKTSAVVSDEGRSDQEAVGPISPAHKGKGKERQRKPSVSKETGSVVSDEEKSVSEMRDRISPAHKGKGKELPPPVEDSRHEKTPKSLGAPRGRKRKRVPSSPISGSPLAQSPGEPKGTLRSNGKSASQSSTTFPQPHSPSPTLDKGVSTPGGLRFEEAFLGTYLAFDLVQFESTVAGPSHSSSSYYPAFKTQPPVSSVPARRPLEPESVQLTSHDHSPSKPPLSDLPIPVSHPYSQRYPSHPPSIFSSPNQGAFPISLPAHPPPPLDPVQAQQAHYLLAQAMHQLSYLLSATMPPYAGYTSTPGQPHYSPPPLPPHPEYSSPIHHHPHFHGTRHYPTPSSSVLPPSSPVLSSISPPPVEEQRARSQGRSKSRGRRVSFRIDSEEVITSMPVQPDPQHSGQKNRKQNVEVKREKGKGKATEQLDNSLRLGDRSSPPCEVSRGRTPGPPSRKKIDVSRGRSLNRR
ncbi:hypothetical protein JVT61DRAFT_1167 [Boletus reticuloceps]|uniref:Uncharacterized protein n=1 Tax=Boletus reticuloceps TaxID=495285 RepID=A0A8I3A9R6_9AGAM|nr:hypothetical protein JVT61DRAFT_1167 [Boletus reticuloceps]